MEQKSLDSAGVPEKSDLTKPQASTERKMSVSWYASQLCMN